MCRQADRQVVRQSQSAEFESLPQPFARQAAAQRDEEIALLRKLLLQWRQGLFDLRQRGLLSDNIGLGDVAQLVLLLQQRKNVGLDLDDAVRGGNLAAQRSLLHGRAGEVRRQCQVCRLEREALRVRLGSE